MAKAKAISEIEELLTKEIERNKDSLLRASSYFDLEIVLAQTNSLLNVFYSPPVISEELAKHLNQTYYASMHLLNEFYRSCNAGMFEEQQEGSMEKSRAWFYEQGGNWEEAVARLVQRGN